MSKNIAVRPIFVILYSPCFIKDINSLNVFINCLVLAKQNKMETVQIKNVLNNMKNVKYPLRLANFVHNIIMYHIAFK